jgi:hypothetical protein
MKFKPGLVFGSALEDLYQYAKENKFFLFYGKKVSFKFINV